MDERDNASDLSSQGETAFIVNSDIESRRTPDPIMRPTTNQSGVDEIRNLPFWLSLLFLVSSFESQIGELDLKVPNQIGFQNRLHRVRSNQSSE